MEETIGDATGLDSWTASGKERQAEGDVEHKQAQAQGYVKGTVDVATGALNKVVGTLKGDTSQEIAGGYFISYAHLTQLTCDQGMPARRRARSSRRRTSRDPSQTSDLTRVVL